MTVRVAVDRFAVLGWGGRGCFGFFGQLNNLSLLLGVGIVRVEQSHGDLGHSDRTAVACAGEDDVFHAGAAERLGGLLAQHPADGVAQVGLTTTVGADDGGDASSRKTHFRPVDERLEPLDFDSLQL